MYHRPPCGADAAGLRTFPGAAPISKSTLVLPLVGPVGLREGKSPRWHTR